MILIDLINNLFDTPLLLFGVYSIFNGPGSESNSGKLSFKSIIAGTGIGITQTDNCILVQDTNNQISLGVVSKRVAIGTGTGITGSTIVSVCNGGIIGARMLSYESPSTSLLSDLTSDKSGFLIGGCQNTILSGKHNIIMGGFTNSISSSYGLISSSCKSILNGGQYNSIIGSSFSRINSGTYNTIIGGTGSYINDGAGGGSNGSTIINSNVCMRSTISGISVIGSSSPYEIYGMNGYGNSIISAKNFKLSYGAMSSMIATENSKICMPNSTGTTTSNNTILASYCNICISYSLSTSSSFNFISGGFVPPIGATLSGIFGSCYSSIFPSFSRITDSRFSTILNGNDSIICNSIKSVIISSENDFIESSCRSAIINSISSCICSSRGTTLLGRSSSGNNQAFCSVYSTINGFSNQTCNTIGSFIAGYENAMRGNKTYDVTPIPTLRSSAIFGNGNFMITSSTFSNFTQNLIIGLGNNCISFSGSTNSVSSGNSILGTCLNTITQSSAGDIKILNANFINGCLNTICNSRVSGIIGSTGSLISCSCNSTIIGSNNSIICCSGVSSFNNAIIGSSNACLKDSRNSVIIGATGSLDNCDHMTKTNLVRIFGEVYTGNYGQYQGLGYSNIPSGSVITSISVRNGVIISINWI